MNNITDKIKKQIAAITNVATSEMKVGAVPKNIEYTITLPYIEHETTVDKLEKLQKGLSRMYKTEVGLVVNTKKKQLEFIVPLDVTKYFMIPESVAKSRVNHLIDNVLRGYDPYLVLEALKKNDKVQEISGKMRIGKILGVSDNYDKGEQQLTVQFDKVKTIKTASQLIKLK